MLADIIGSHGKASVETAIIGLYEAAAALTATKRIKSIPYLTKVSLMDEIPNICYQPGKIMLGFRTIALFSFRARLDITAPVEESGATAAAPVENS